MKILLILVFLKIISAVSIAMKKTVDTYHQKKDPETGKLVKELNILYGDSNIHLS